MDFMFMQHLASINFIAVLVCAVLYFCLGSLWFSGLFGAMWVEELQKINVTITPPTPADLKLKMGLTFVCNLIASLDMALIVHVTGSTTVFSGLQLGMLVAIGFVATSMGAAYVWASRPLKLSIIDIGYPMVGVIITAIILSVWR